MTRLDYFNEKVDGIILQMFATRDFLEVVVDRYGDVIKYRVYGNEQEGFRLCVK